MYMHRACAVASGGEEHFRNIQAALIFIDDRIYLKLCKIILIAWEFF